MRIVYLPIDERPCNTKMVEMIAESVDDIKLITPPRKYFGYKKTQADTEKLWEWILEEMPGADALILTIDMLIYGGLIPSRLHYLTSEMGKKWIERIRFLGKNFPNVPIYAANVIMRTPKYSSSDEEPDYYAQWGREIYLRSYLLDKKSRLGLSDAESNQLWKLEESVPKEYIKDYEERRNFNSFINSSVIDLVKEGIIKFLSIPQDDSSEYGYTAIDQKKVMMKREQLRLHHQIQIYPGSDEVGATLLARVYNDLNDRSPKIYPLWSSTLGPQLIPLYEDRPMMESLKAHIEAAGCRMADNIESADLILAYNIPGRVMQESWEQKSKDVTYVSFRNISVFAKHIKELIQNGKKVIVADSAYANGGDKELITLLDDEGILDQLISYKGWNTNCNTLGSTISQGVIGLYGKQDIIKRNLIYHLLDDYFYQAEIRMEMVSDFLPKHELNYFDLKDKAEIVNIEKDKRLQKQFEELIRNSFKDITIKNIKTYAPWNRMFETGIDLNIEKRS